MNMKETIALGGRKFHATAQRITASQDDFIVAHLRLSGSIEIIHGIDGVERTEEKKGEDMLTAIMLNGRTHLILAGLLTEDGTTWKRESANKNAEFFASLTDPADKILARRQLLEFIVGFFSLGGPSSATSRKSPSATEKVPIPSITSVERTGTSFH
jgi:hypothetical protein